ncbi:NYN domain-containing protein [Hydrogenophaga sp. PAMC20947]|uniref:NYN domain-containing protein n=1 Tax=Hydrogenophaga sp. PAMC20947 TaxID=2565558 RepID=UPI00109DA83D|nr:NYN domain-containing protein [Hydrogenophaga sp. PAMC20947]QCB46303.1 NYN domain-containing protein [Hydrogenophaga sp. PAMC20947]
MIVFLVDADNLSAPAWVDEAFKSLEASSGPIAVRRAYGSAENLKGLAETLRTWAIRPFVNLSLTKNTTDIALAADAMELACQKPAPSMIVLGSGDADFVPLVVRLRERGIKVVCVSEYSKMAQEAVRAYDAVIYVGKGKSARASRAPTRGAPLGSTAGAAKKTTPNAAGSVTHATTAVKSAAPAAPKPAKKAVAAKKVAMKAATASGASTSGRGVTVAQILAAAPSLKPGDWQPLGDIVKALHDKKLMGKSATSSRFFGKHAESFELKPAKQPNQVRYILLQG